MNNNRKLVIALVAAFAIVALLFGLFKTLQSANQPDCNDVLDCRRDFVSDVRKNDKFNKLDDESLIIRGNLICANLRGGIHPVDLIDQINGVDPSVSKKSATVLIQASSKYLCADQKLKVERAL